MNKELSPQPPSRTRNTSWNGSTTFLREAVQQRFLPGVDAFNRRTLSNSKNNVRAAKGRGGNSSTSLEVRNLGSYRPSVRPAMLTCGPKSHTEQSKSRNASDGDICLI